MNRRMNGDIFPGWDTIPRLQSDFINGLFGVAGAIPVNGLAIPDVSGA